jgi:hypothetical protein
LDAFSTRLGNHVHARSLVIGTERETQGNAPTAYAAFCVDPATGRVVYVELDAPFSVRCVNSGLTELLASLARFVAWRSRLAATDPDAAIAGLRSERAAIDAAAMCDPEANWPTYLDVIST